MCRKLMFLISFVFVLGMISTASGADYTWTNVYPWSSLWLSGQNWDPVAPAGGPGIDDTAYLAYTEIPLVIDGETVVRRIRCDGDDGLDEDILVLFIGDANVVVTQNIRLEDTGDDTVIFQVGDNTKLQIDGDDDWGVRLWGDNSRMTWNITGDAQVTTDADWQVGDDDDDHFELNIDSGYLYIGNENDGWRQNEGELNVSISGDAVVECEELRWRMKSEDYTNTLTMSGDAILSILDGNFQTAGGSSNFVVNILDNAVMEMDGDWRFGEDNDYEALSTLNMDGQLIVVGEDFIMVDDDGSKEGHFSTVNLLDGVIDVSNGRLRSETDNWHLEVEAGMMILNNDVRDQIEDQRVNGFIGAYNTRGDLVTDYNEPGYEGKTRVYAIPKMRRAWNPSPAVGETDVPVNGTVLSWNAGDFAEIHHVFFSDDQSLVESRSLAVYLGGMATTSVALGPLQVGTTYYWVVDEQDEAVIIEDGLLWSFTTESTVAVEGFEEYTPNPNYIFDSWIDGCGDVNGVGGNGTGSCVDLAYDVVHGGTKSMLYAYDNTGSFRDANYSEATYTYSEAQDWTDNGEAALVAYFFGNEDNDSSELWIVLNGNLAAMATYGDNGMGDDPEDIKAAEWTEWNIDLADFAAGGVDLANVTSITIGMGDRMTEVGGGVGSIHIDDLGLYPVRCVPKYTPDIFDLNADCVVDGKDIGIIANSWLDDER